MSKLFKTAMLLFTAILSAATVNAAEFFVDPDLGDDTFDGSSPKPVGGGSKTGPRKTLVGVMELVTANNGDVVYAAPGRYSSLKTTGNYRVSIPAGTSLIASGKAEETFIIGENAPGVAVDASPWGCGTDAVRCVEMAANSKLVGFTVCGGRAPVFSNDSSTSKWGAGVHAANSNNVVVADCIISNNVAGRAGGMSHGIAVRCEFMNNRAHTSGPHVMRSSLYNCYLHDALSGGGTYHASQSTMRNCHLIGSANACNVFNSYVESDRSANKFYFSSYDTKSSGTTSVFENSFKAATTAMQLDENLRPLKGSHNGIDKGSYYYYTNGMPKVVAELLGVDFKKGQRVYNGEIDIGCGEYDPRSDWVYSLTRSDCCLADHVSPGVVSASSGGVEIPGGAEMTLTWTPPESYASAMGYSFRATVAGEAVLIVYRDGKEVARWSAEDGEQSFGYAAAGSHSLRFVCEGEGEASVSKFKSMLGRAWYVNEETGSDSFDGTSPVHAGGDSLTGPRKTLAGAMAISDLVSGDVVHVAAGTYDEGEMKPTGGIGGITTNRVVVKAGVGLVADDGPEVTFIVGKKPTEGGNTGSDAIRCVYLNAGAWLYGFTVTNGATCRDGSYMDYGGGVCAASEACAVNCRFTYNSARRGGAAYGGWYIACRFEKGNAGNESSGIYDCQGVFNSYFDNCKPYGKWKLVNCTFKNCSPQANGSQNVYNCLVEDESNKNCNYYNCVLTGRNAGEANPDAATRFNVTDAQRDAETVRPTAGSSLVDAGVLSYYNDNFPADWVMFKMSDLGGGQRVYGEGKIDVGAGEYDWRGAFAKALHHSKATVTAASEGVRSLDGDVTLGGGDELVVNWQVAGESKAELYTSLSGEGNATITLDGEVLVLDASGVTAFVVQTGTHTLKFSYSGEGTFTVSSIRCRAGLTVFVR